MRRYWIDKSQIQDGKVHFHGDVFHHIFDVCRQDVGSKFEVLTDGSKAYFVEVTSVEKKQALAIIKEARDIPELKAPHLEIILSISRFPVMDAIMEKAVELGVKKIHPVTSDYSFLRIDDKISDNKIERWKKIIISSTQQSGRGDLMELAPVQTLSEMLHKINLNSAIWGLFCYEGSTTLGIKEALTKKIKNESSPPKGILCFIGSEGGFSENEVEKFNKLGLSPVTLGQQVMRVETACIATISVLKYEFDLMR